MNQKKRSGLIGIVVGGLWFLNGLRHVGEQGFVAIAFPLLILGAGIVYFVQGRSAD
jgi:hypothetical protein